MASKHLEESVLACVGKCKHPSFFIMYYAVLLGLSKPNAARIPVLEVWWPYRNVSPECSLDFLIRKRGKLSTSKLQRKPHVFNGRARTHPQITTYMVRTIKETMHKTTLKKN